MEQTEFLELVEEHDYESEPTDSEFARILKKAYRSSGLKIDEKSNFVIITRVRDKQCLKQLKLS